MPVRKHKKYKKPKRPFDSARIKEEAIILKKYGLKNKKEIWKADSAIEKIRKQAKLLLTKDKEDQDKFLEKLAKQGFPVASIADTLALNKEDYLKRRLQSIVVTKKLATQPKQARQFITHKHIAIEGNIVNIPSYLVKTDEESKIELKLVKKEKKSKNGIKEMIDEIKENKPEEGKVEGVENA